MEVERIMSGELSKTLEQAINLVTDLERRTINLRTEIAQAVASTGGHPPTGHLGPGAGIPFTANLPLAATGAGALSPQVPPLMNLPWTTGLSLLGPIHQNTILPPTFGVPGFVGPFGVGAPQLPVVNPAHLGLFGHGTSPLGFGSLGPGSFGAGPLGIPPLGFGSFGVGAGVAPHLPVGAPFGLNAPNINPFAVPSPYLSPFGANPFVGAFGAVPPVPPVLPSFPSFPGIHSGVGFPPVPFQSGIHPVGVPFGQLGPIGAVAPGMFPETLSHPVTREVLLRQGLSGFGGIGNLPHGLLPGRVHGFGGMGQSGYSGISGISGVGQGVGPQQPYGYIW